jgi:hypothetical protein
MGLGRWRLTNLVAALAMVATLGTLAVGLPAIDRALPAERPVSALRPYPVGGGITVVPPPGATIDVTRTRPGDAAGTVLFVVGPVRYAIVVRPFDGDLSTAAGRLRSKITEKPGYQVTGAETRTVTDSGLTGIQGGYTAPGRGGRYAVFLTRGLAIEVTVSGDDMGHGRVLAAVDASARTISDGGDR